MLAAAHAVLVDAEGHRDFVLSAQVFRMGAHGQWHHIRPDRPAFVSRVELEAQDAGYRIEIELETVGQIDDLRLQKRRIAEGEMTGLERAHTGRSGQDDGTVRVGIGCRARGPSTRSSESTLGRGRQFADEVSLDFRRVDFEIRAQRIPVRRGSHLEGDDAPFAERPVISQAHGQRFVEVRGHAVQAKRASDPSVTGGHLVGRGIQFDLGLVRECTGGHGQFEVVDRQGTTARSDGCGRFQYVRIVCIGTRRVITGAAQQQPDSGQGPPHTDLPHAMPPASRSDGSPECLRAEGTCWYRGRSNHM